jgi:hypothetical protein
MKNDDNPGICFGFVINENSGSDYEARLIFHDKLQERQAKGIPN